jgi:hypothetical protein
MTTEIDIHELDDCYSCMGTGRIQGFGHTGKPCPCLARNDCHDCGEPTGHEHDGDPDTVLICDACAWYAFLCRLSGHDGAGGTVNSTLNVLADELAGFYKVPPGDLI